MKSRTNALGAGGAVLGGALWARYHPSACPYSQRWLLEIPRPFLSRGRLREILEPAPGERILEVGPGTGFFSLAVAEWLRGGDGREPGQLDIFDLQQEMLDDTMRRAGEAGVHNIEPAQGDARSLPYADSTFDAVYLVTVLGEIPDQDAALRELRRVLKPTGRMVFGETVLDPHLVTFRALRERAEGAGLRFERQLGNWFGFFARFAAA
jgi:ubiquinone/menaquinone biosynthesis C-methylase UbiE